MPGGVVGGTDAVDGAIRPIELQEVQVVIQAGSDVGQDSEPVPEGDRFVRVCRVQDCISQVARKVEFSAVHVQVKAVELTGVSTAYERVVLIIIAQCAAPI